MTAEEERWECPSCGTPLNIADLGIYAKVACPNCGLMEHVHTVLANFRVEGVLGVGGMSVVLRARDLVLDRPLAIKLLNEYYRDQPERIARFENECELMAKVRHENVVSVYSAGWAKGQFYIAMELINGRNLEEIISQNGPLDPAYALEVVRQVTLGLDAAHRAGLLHRDMKPGNIIICEDGRAKVLDFGLSLGTRDEDTEEVIWATPFYVPPETLMREAEDLRTDMYALGMTLRHLITGQENFETVPQSIEEMLECKRQLPPIAAIMPELDEAYCDLVDHMTSYDVASRPASYSSLLVEIDEVRAALSAAGQEGKAAARRQFLLNVLGGVVLALVLGAGAASVTSTLATPAPEYQYISPSKTLDWNEHNLIALAMEEMKSGNSAEAVAALAELADSEGEPAACAWAALHARMLNDLEHGFQQEDISTYFLQRAHYHLSRTPAPAGQSLHAEMLKLLPSSRDEVEFKPLCAISRLARAGEFYIACKDAEAHSQMRDALIALSDAGAVYRPLCERLVDLQQTMDCTRPARISRYYERHYKPLLLSRLDVTAAARALELKASTAQDEREQERCRVQREALELFGESLNTLRRHMSLPQTEQGLTVETLIPLAAKLGQPRLPEELAALMLMAQGQFTEASALNPYRAEPNSAEPFAIIMRDWLFRLSQS